MNIQNFNQNSNGSASNNASGPERNSGKKKKIRLHIEDVTLENEYYIDISKRYRLAKFIVLILLIIYILAMISIYREEITIENFRYMIKYLDNSTLEYEGEYNTIYYNNDGHSDYAYYKGELAVVSGSEMNLFAMSGISDLNLTLTYTEPKIMPSAKYMLVYDFFGNSYSLYNSFSQLYSETLEYPISDAAISDSGMYAVVTKTQEYRSAVIFYDKNFEQVSQILKEKYVMDIDITDDGEKALVVSAYNSEGIFNCEIMTINPYSDKPESLAVYEDKIPLKAGYNAVGGYTVLCDTGVTLYDSDNRLVSEYDFGGLQPAKCDIGEYYTSVALSQNVVVNENRIIFFNVNGKAVYEEIIKGEILEIKTDKDFAYIVFDGKLMKIDLYSGESGECEIEKNCMELIVVNDRVLLLCYNNKCIALENTAANFGLSKPEETEAAYDGVVISDVTENEETDSVSDETNSQIS